MQLNFPSTGANVRALLAASCCAWALPSASPAIAAEQFAIELAPGSFDEHCLRLGAGEAIRWRFTATDAVDFNIHAHRGEVIVYPVRRERVERASGSLRGRAAEDYCLMWTNAGGSRVQVRGSVERQP
jgi:hypothetical protein